MAKTAIIRRFSHTLCLKFFNHVQTDAQFCLNVIIMHYPIVSNYIHFLFNLLLSINQEFKMSALSTQTKGVISIIRILPTDHSDAWRANLYVGN